MSTTVSYKGATIATVSNDTKTLLTEGKYLEDDLTLVDVSGGGAVLTTKNISANGTYNASSDSADGYSQVTVAVPASAVDTGTKNITANGNGQDVIGYAAVNVAVPNSYSAGDEGKVVSNGALVAQTSDTVTTNDTYDTTLINSLTVNVSGGGGDNLPSVIAQDGTLGDYTNNVITDLRVYAFYYYTGITGFFSTSVDTIRGGAFRNCTELTTINVPNLSSMAYGGDVFNGCTKLLSAMFPKLASSNGNGNFAGCSKLETVDYGKADIAVNTFLNCAKLDTLILRKTTVASLANVNAFSGTPFKSGGTGGHIYIPKTLYDALGTGTNDYKAASNWSTVNGYGTITWHAIEGSQYE